MKALTLTQPYATAITLGYKSIETRSWGTKYRGQLAIHAAKGFPQYAKDFAADELAVGRLFTPLPLSCVVAIVDFIDCALTETALAAGISSLERRYGDYSPGRFAWLFENVQVLETPIPARGALGLWNWEPGDV